MMKRILFSLILASALVACSSNDKYQELELPTISDVEITNPNADKDNPLTITLGQTISFKAITEDTEERFYEWHIDGEKVGDEQEFSFAPEKKGEYKLVLKALNEDLKLIEKEIGTITVNLPTITIASLSCGEEVVQDMVSVTATSKLAFEVKAENPEYVTNYYWILNGDTIQDANTSKLEYSLGLSGTLKVALHNEDNISTDKEIELVGPYKDGVFLYGASFVGFGFVDEAGKEYGDNVFENANDGKSVGDGGINDFNIFNNKAYILTPNSSVRKAQVVVADAQTLKEIDRVTAEGFNTETLGEIYNLLVVSEDKAYIGNNKSSAGNLAGVRVLDMKEKTFTSAPITGTEGTMGTDGPAWSRMIKVNENSIAIACGSKLKFVNIETDKVDESKTIELKEKRQVGEVLKAKGNKIYALVNAEKDGWMPAVGTASIVEINSETLEVISTKDLLLDGANLELAGGFTGGAKGSSSPIKDEIYFPGTGWGLPSIYKYDIKANKVSKFADTSDSGIGGMMLGGYMGIDSKGILYVPISNYSNSTTAVYDTESGKQLTDREYTVPGDASVAPTWMFN